MRTHFDRRRRILGDDHPSTLASAHNLARRLMALGEIITGPHQRGLRALGERGFALLTGRWRALQRITASPSRIGDITAATRMLTEYEQRDLHRSC